jgi:hypothetical protein
MDLDHHFYTDSAQSSQSQPYARHPRVLKSFLFLAME